MRGRRAFTGELPGEFLYFYHPDNLGSTSYVTDDKGAIYEHLQYFPFGETWVQEGQPSNRIPYLFSSKELDAETNLYYFGARYYDPRTSVWISADPAFPKFLPDPPSQENENPERSLAGGGGVFRSHNLGLYTFTQSNPLRLTDPDGLDTRPAPGQITSGFGEREFEGEQEDHDAVDMANKTGAPVVAFRRGEVRKVTQGQGEGGKKANSVTIRFPAEGGRKQEFGIFAHVTTNLKVGDTVEEGEVIGQTDLSGRTTGGNLHFQLLTNDNKPIDPTGLLEAADAFPAGLGIMPSSEDKAAGDLSGGDKPQAEAGSGFAVLGFSSPAAGGDGEPATEEL